MTEAKRIPSWEEPPLSHSTGRPSLGGRAKSFGAFPFRKTHDRGEIGLRSLKLLGIPSPRASGSGQTKGDGISVNTQLTEPEKNVTVAPGRHRQHQSQPWMRHGFPLQKLCWSLFLSKACSSLCFVNLILLMLSKVSTCCLSGTDIRLIGL